MTIRSLAAAVSVAVALSIPGTVAAQEPPDTTVRADTLVAPADTVAAPAPAAAPDTVPLPDSLRFRELPALDAGAPAGFHTGVWEWDRTALMAAPALTLLELLETVPGLLPLRGGDYGTPEGLSAFGLGGGRIRVYWDGFEMLPLDGAVVDLASVGLQGVGGVRVERGLGEVRVEIGSLRAFDARPMSVVEAGTGDLDTNYFRGTFLHPEALGGSLGLSLERLDTRGTDGDEEGSRLGAWFRYTWHFGDRGGIRAEYRRATVQSALDTFPDERKRGDWIVRGRWELVDGLVAEAWTGASSVEGPEDGFTPIEGDRSQHGVRASWNDGGPLWARGAFRLMSDPALPSTSLELEAGGALEALGGASARMSLDGWDGEGAGLLGVRAWTRPLYGLSAFASYESGERGARHFEPRVEVPLEVDPEAPEEPEEPEEPLAPTHRITDYTGLRLGGAFQWGPVSLAGAWLRVESDSLLPLGLHTDREALVLPGGERTGFEVSGRIGMPIMDGLSLFGAMQQWDEEARYLPERTYQGGLDFHDVFLESGNFELWWRVAVEGRDPMLVPFQVADAGPDDPVELQRVPFRQTWNAYIEARILTLHLIIRWDNFTIRQNNQDYPGRLQPATRATYGIRWTLWN